MQASGPDENASRLLIEQYGLLGGILTTAGKATAAEELFHKQARLLDGLYERHAGDPSSVLGLVTILERAAFPLEKAKQASAALARLRQAADLLVRFANLPSRNPKFKGDVASLSLTLSAPLLRLHAAAESLTMANLARRAHEEACSGFSGTDRDWFLSSCWYRTAKACWALGQYDESLAALREGLAAQRRMFDNAPELVENRVVLSVRYDRLAYFTRLRCNYQEAEAMLLEREKLWPNNAEQLLKIAQDFEELAEMARKASPRPTVARQEGIRRYGDHGVRIRRVAETLSH